MRFGAIARLYSYHKLTMIKKIISSLFLLTVIITFVNAQQNQSHTDLPIDSRLYSVFEGSYLERLRTENPFLIQRWNFYLDHSWYLTPLPPEKTSEAYPLIRVADLENVNIFLLEKKLRLTRDWNQHKVYRIENTDKALVFYSGKEFTRKLNEHLKQ